MSVGVVNSSLLETAMLKADLPILNQRFRLVSVCLVEIMPVMSVCNVGQVAKCHIKLELKNESFTELQGEIAGPPDTPYEGATYILDIKIPETYPFNPPKVCLHSTYTVSQLK